MEEGASPRWALDKKLGEDASMEEKKEGEKERGWSTKKTGQMTSEVAKRIADKIVSHVQLIIVIIYVYCVIE